MPMPMSEDDDELEQARLEDGRTLGGRGDTTEAKISSDMPLPIPRWVMSSPSHMIMAVPAVSVMTISITRAAPKCGMRSLPWRAAEFPRKPPLPWWRANTMPVDCIRASATVR